MHGNDWNGNGKRDAFDRYVDMKASNNDDSSAPKDGRSSDETQHESQGNGITIVKSLLTIGICLGGFILPAAADMGTGAAAIYLLAAVGIGVLMWQK